MISWGLCGPGVYAGQGTLVNGVCHFAPSYESGCTAAGGTYAGSTCSAGASPSDVTVDSLSNCHHVGYCSYAYDVGIWTGTDFFTNSEASMCASGGFLIARDRGYLLADLVNQPVGGQPEFRDLCNTL